MILKLAWKKMFGYRKTFLGINMTDRKINKLPCKIQDIT